MTVLINILISIAYVINYCSVMSHTFFKGILVLLSSIKTILLVAMMLSLISCVSDIKEKLQFPDKIDESKIIEDQKIQVQKTLEAGPQLNKENVNNTKNSRTRLSENINLHSEGFFKLNSNERLFINLKGADVRALAEAISKVTNKNIIVGKEVDTTIRARLNDISVASALDIILSSHGLYQVTDQNLFVLSIHNPDIAKAMETAGAEKIKRKTLNSVTEVFRIHYADLTMLKDNIIEIFSQGTTEETKDSSKSINITVDDRTRSLIVNGSPLIMDKVSEIIAKLDRRTNVVLIEAIIVLAKDTFAEALGARLGLTRNSNTLMSGIGGDSTTNASGNAALTSPTGTATQLAVGNAAGTISNTLPSSVAAGIGIITGIGDINRLKLEIAALESESLSRVLSNPRIFTMDNTTASISKGDQVPYTNTTGADGATVLFVDAVLKLEVTPSVVGDGNVILTIQLNNDSADTTQSNPPISKTQINTTLLVKSGQIVVIGGTTVDDKSQTNTGVPYLKDLPFIGEFFKGVSNSDKLTELLIFISPVVL